MTHKDDFAHSTLGALSGGVTTVLEMPNAIPPVDSLAMFEERREYHETSAWTDFGLWGLALGDANLDQIAPMFAAGAVAVKLFWGYALRRDTRSLVYNTGDEPAENVLMPPDNGAVLRLFQAVAAAGGVLAAHCEDKDILAASEAALGHPIESYADLLAARPDTAEAVTISIAAELAAASGCRFHVVHMASSAGLEAVRSARRRGIELSAESCPQYLTLTAADFPRVGPVMKVYPPVRHESDQSALWDGIAEGSIVSIGSDHAPHTVEEKAQPLSTQPAGAVGCETLGPLMIDAMLRGRTTPERLAQIMSTSTARLYGLYPRKGVIRPGSDADLTIVDPNASRVIRNDELVAKQPVSPWHGTELKGAPVAAVLRGQLVMRGGRPVGERSGRFVAADHSPCAASAQPA
jgi:dihydroorotase